MVLACWCFSSAYAFTHEETLDPCYDWMDCLIEKELSQVNPIFFSQKNIEKASKENKEFIFRFQIRNNRYLGPPSALQRVIEYLTRDLVLPDLEALYFNANGPTQICQVPLSDAVLLAGSKHISMKNVLCFHHPYFIPDEGGRFVEDRILEETLASSGYPWEKRKDQLVWRGSNSGMQLYTCQNWMKLYRGRLVFFSSLYPAIIDAKFTHLHPHKCESKEALQKIVPFGNKLTNADLAQYKYQIILQGDTAVSYSYIQKLALGCLVFKPESPIVMWFYDALIPYVHYIPVRDSLSDLPRKIKQAIDQDDEMRQIALNGREFAQTHLRSKDLLIYCYKVLCEYAKRQRAAK